MALRDGDKLNRIEELKSKLFSKNYQMKIEHRDKFTRSNRADVPDAWGMAGKNSGSTPRVHNDFFKKTSMIKNFFIFSVAFFLITLSYASYVFFAGGNTVSNDNIEISVIGNNFTAGGEELSLVVGITNRNSSDLDLVDLVVEYPKDSSNSVNLEVDLSVGTTRFRQSLGTIPSGAVRNENLKLVLFGQQGSVRPIKISIEYRVEGSNAIFVKEKIFEVTVSSTPINLSVDAPSVISPNQDVTLNVKLVLNASTPASKILMKFDYPVGFQFISAEPAPTLGNNVWSLGDLPPGAERDISVLGKMIDVFDGEEKVFHIRSGSQSASDKSKIDVVFNSIAHNISVKKPFIEAKLFINGESEREYATNTKTPIYGEIRWTNNLGTKVNDLEIQAKILGNAVDRKTINAQQGFYNSSENVITWDKNSQRKFREVNPGDSGSVQFSVSSISLFSSSDGVLSDPSVNIEISISGKQLVEGYATQDLNNFDSSVIRIISDVGFATQGLYYSGAFVNTGPIPPVVEQQTTYTIVWSLSNTSNSVSRSEIRSTLPSWVSFVGPVSPTSEDLSYNASTKEIVWDIGKISKGTGISGLPRSVSFQVKLNPSLSQVGTIPVLINGSVLTGHDDFANVDIRSNKGPVYSKLDNDPAFPNFGGIVVESQQ